MGAKKKQKQVSIEEYIETYCQEKRIRGRFAVYVSPEAHLYLKEITRLFKNEHHTTTSSLADSIILHHIEIHKKFLGNIHAKDAREFMERFNNTGYCDEKEQSDDDPEEESESY